MVLCPPYGLIIGSGVRLFVRPGRAVSHIVKRHVTIRMDRPTLADPRLSSVSYIFCWLTHDYENLVPLSSNKMLLCPIYRSLDAILLKV